MRGGGEGREKASAQRFPSSSVHLFESRNSTHGGGAHTYQTLGSNPIAIAKKKLPRIASLHERKEKNSTSSVVCQIGTRELRKKIKFGKKKKGDSCLSLRRRRIYKSHPAVLVVANQLSISIKKDALKRSLFTNGQQ